MPSVYLAEYPYLFRTPYQMEDGKCPKEYFTQFDDLFKKIVDPSMVAAIIMEPIQGEGGYTVPPVEWLKYVRALCDKHGILLIFDEIQPGFGRTGNLYAWQTLGIKPEIFTSAKAIGDVRGMGLMNAMEFVKPEDNAPNGDLCSAVINEALKRDLLLLSRGADKNNIRLIPPLNVDERTLDAAFEIIEESITAALKG